VDGDGRDRYTVDAVARALAVLKVVAEAPDLGLSDIARTAGESKARTFRLLRTLEQQGYVTCLEPSRRYRLGYGAVVLGHLAHGQVDIAQVAQPVLRKLGEAYAETVQLSVPDGDDTLCIANWVPQRELRVQGRVGRRRAMHAGSSKALLAFMAPDVQERVLARMLERYTARTITDAKVLRATLQRIREEGHYVSRGEVSPDLVSVAAPVFGANGTVAAQVNVAAPESRMPPKRLKDAIRDVRAAAAELSELMGHRPSR
jgi:DNA-binding IclR family transcriptional regulator